MQFTALEKGRADTWVELGTKATANAVAGLSQMIGRKVEATGFCAKRASIRDETNMLGGANARTVAVHLVVTGCAGGHALLAYDPRTAFDLVDILMETPRGSTKTLGEMERSVLGEMGNIMASFFLNTLANATGLDLRVSPPVVIMDLAGAIVDFVLGEVVSGDAPALIMETAFGTDDRQVKGVFLVLPDLDLQKALLSCPNAS